ncbi:hypothetical protein NL676_008382 [Syzygium grande]|nr:hypothetical protein NL676_008382 [Syzygium grande]
MDQSSSQGDLRDLLHLNIDLSRKVNWLCTTPAVTENLIELLCCIMEDALDELAGHFVFPIVVMLGIEG